MELHCIRHLWGITESWQAAFPKIRQSAYQGIETSLPPPDQAAAFQEMLREYEFSYIADIFTEGQTVAQHLESFRKSIETAAAFQPRLINSHSGRDAWTDAESEDFFAEALVIEAQFGIAIAHETHRGRTLFNPWITSRLLSQFPALKLCCDLSHWVCVCERLLETEAAIIQQAARHCHHIHARVGYEEGPQVPDPRAPEYRRHLEAHEAWWRMIWQAQRAKGFPLTTLTPEFGPPPYLQSLPFTNAPVTDLWAVCDWMAERERAIFAHSETQDEA
jgi:hypothetical protein